MANQFTQNGANRAPKPTPINYAKMFKKRLARKDSFKRSIDLFEEPEPDIEDSLDSIDAAEPTQIMRRVSSTGNYQNSRPKNLTSKSPQK